MNRLAGILLLLPGFAAAADNTRYDCRLVRLNTTAHEYGRGKKAERPDLAGGEQHEFEMIVKNGSKISFTDLGNEIVYESSRMKKSYPVTRPEKSGVPALSWGTIGTGEVSFMYFINTGSLAVSRSSEFFDGWETVFTQYFKCRRAK